MSIIRRYAPDVILGMGGFVSGPSGLAAWLLRKRLIIHEQNSIPGITNKILAHLASVVLTGFPGFYFSAYQDKSKPGLTRKDEIRGKSERKTGVYKIINDRLERVFNKVDRFSRKSCKKYVYVGNPVRQGIAAIAPPQQRYNQHIGKIRLLVFGGSRGALAFNRIIPKAISLLARDNCPIIWHQAGEKYLAVAQEEYHKYGVEARVDPFITDMQQAYEWADLVIARAGASTIAELSAVGIAALLVPYPHAVDDHQTTNAYFLVHANAAQCLSQVKFNAVTLADSLAKLISSRHLLLEMAENGRNLRKVDAAAEMVRILQATDFL
jgi:UDP-N-acetylglucosamine--N-acetylmuramyl-(pentapeptide) pyrophosphoryl-undecaprenol N-acetylglucosamine transferase